MIISPQSSVSDSYDAFHLSGKQDKQTSTLPGDESAGKPATAKTPGKSKLSDDEQKEVKELRSRDTEVRTHEMAHIAAGGQYVRGAAHYSYQTGPDGNRYAIGGEVSIDTSTESSPDATINKMRVVERAALAPADPSPEDRSVAAEAEKKIMAAQQEKAQAAAENAKPAKASTSKNQAHIKPAAPSTRPVGSLVDTVM